MTTLGYQILMYSEKENVLENQEKPVGAEPSSKKRKLSLKRKPKPRKVKEETERFVIDSNPKNGNYQQRLCAC